MIFVGIDDTDTLESPGTNQLAKAIVRAAQDDWRCVRIVRHQLFIDPGIPYTSKNGSASITFEHRTPPNVDKLASLCEQIMQQWYVEGSDPGLCITEAVPEIVTAFGKICQREIVTHTMAREIAATSGIFLKGLGGTEGGVIGSLAAVGLAVTGDDGRVVQHGEWPDDLSGHVSVEILRQRDIDVVNMDESLSINEGIVDEGFVDVGKHLRANRRGGRTVLFVRADKSISTNYYTALKLT